MKIAFVTSIGIHKHGGTQKAVAWLVEDLSRKHDISVFTPRIEELNASRIKFYKIPVISKPAILRYLTFLFLNTIYFTVLKAFKKDRFDIINVTGADCVFANVITAHYCVAEYMHLVRRRIVPYPEKNMSQRLLNLSYRIYYLITNITERWIYSRKAVKLIIAVSEGLKRDIIRRYHRSPEDIVVIPNAVDDEMFMDKDEISILREALRAKYAISADDMVLLFVATGDWMRKGLPLVIEALSYINENLKLFVVGKDEIATYLAIAESYKVADRVIFTGPTSDVKKFYAASDIFVFPSYFEGFSMVILEAAASGLPIIATKINGSEDLIQDGYNGFFVRHDPKNIAEKVDILLNDQELLKRMGENAKRSAVRFRRQDMSKMTEEVFMRLIAMSNRTTD